MKQARFLFVSGEPSLPAHPPHMPASGMPPVAKARATDPETSHEAAASVARISDAQGFILKMLNTHGPLTDEKLWDLYHPADIQIYHFIHMSISGARSRRAELVKAGLVRDSGERRETRSGRKAIVWEAA